MKPLSDTTHLFCLDCRSIWIAKGWLYGLCQKAGCHTGWHHVECEHSPHHGKGEWIDAKGA